LTLFVSARAGYETGDCDVFGKRVIVFFLCFGIVLQWPRERIAMSERITMNESLPTTAVVRVSRASFDPSRFAEVDAASKKTSESEVSPRIFSFNQDVAH
jgi:hypothetical protein